MNEGVPAERAETVRVSTGLTGGGVGYLVTLSFFEALDDLRFASPE